MYCKNCGNQMKEGEQYCTKCGASLNQQTVIEMNNSTNINTVSIVLGILAIILFLIPIISIPLAIASIITGITSKKENKKIPIGIILGFISIIMTVLAIIALFSFMFIFIKEEAREIRNDFQTNDITEDYYHEYIMPKEHITDIKGYRWLADDKSMLYLNVDNTYTWYLNDDDHEDNYYEGKFQTYKGEEAIKYIATNLKDYGLTEEEQRNFFKDGNHDINDYYLMILTCEKTKNNGKEETGMNNIAYYYGLYSDKTKRIDFTNLSSKLKISLTLKEKTTNIDV